MHNKILCFTSFEQWDDNRPLSIVRTVPTETERPATQPIQLNGRVRTIYNPFSSTLDPRPRRPHAVRQQHRSRAT